MRMDIHSLLCQTNWDLIRGKHWSDEEKEKITRRLLSGISPVDGCRRFGVAAHAGDGRSMYPLFFVPPQNGGRRLMTINGVMPKTHVLSANHYELEILRLLALWRPDDERVRHMLIRTKERLASACFGRFCKKGECFEASIVALRFLATAFPNEAEWIRMLTEKVGSEIGNKPNGKKRHSFTTFYYWLTLTDIDLPVASLEIRRHESRLVHQINRSCSYKIDYDRLYNPIALYIVRNCLTKLPEYCHIREFQGHEGDDGRFHFEPVVRGV